MSVTKTEKKVIIIGCVAFLLTLIVGVIAFGSNNKLSGVYTNGKSVNCASFISIEFSGNTFVSAINIPLGSDAVAREHIADRIEQSADGKYFIRITQHGNFYITDDGYTETITKIFPCGGVRYNQFSQSRNEITIAQTHLTEAVP